MQEPIRATETSAVYMQCVLLGGMTILSTLSSSDEPRIPSRITQPAQEHPQFKTPNASTISAIPYHASCPLWRSRFRKQKQGKRAPPGFPSEPPCFAGDPMSQSVHAVCCTRDAQDCGWRGLAIPMAYHGPSGSGSDVGNRFGWLGRTRSDLTSAPP